MTAWGFVFLAYGIAWGAILVYLFMLKRRFAMAAAELEALRSKEAKGSDAQA